MREPPRRSTVGAAPPLLLLRPGSWTRGGAAALGAGSGGSGAGRGRARRPSRPAARTARWAALLWRCRPEGEGRVPEEAAGVRVRGRGAGAAPRRAWRPQVRAEASGGHPSANFPPRAEGGSLAGAATLCWDRGRQPRDGTPGHLCRCGRCSRGTGQRRAGRARLRSRCHCWPQASVSRTSRRGRGGRCGGCTAQLSAGAGAGRGGHRCPARAPARGALGRPSGPPALLELAEGRHPGNGLPCPARSPSHPAARPLRPRVTADPP